jgi:hypothetical protein
MKTINLSFIEISVKKVEYQDLSDSITQVELPYLGDSFRSNHNQTREYHEFHEIHDFYSEFDEISNLMKQQKLIFKIKELFQHAFYSMKFFTQYEMLAFLPVILNGHRNDIYKSAKVWDHFINIINSEGSGLPDHHENDYLKGLSRYIGKVNDFDDLPVNNGKYFLHHALFYYLVFKDDYMYDNLYKSLLEYPVNVELYL